MTNLRRVQLERTYIVNTTRDITEQKKAERSLRLFEEKFAKAFRASPGMMLIVSLKEGRFIEVNEAFERQLGYVGIPGMRERVRQLGGDFSTANRGTRNQHQGCGSFEWFLGQRNCAVRIGGANSEIA